MLCREVIESEQFILILEQTLSNSRVLVLVCLDKQVKRSDGVLACFRHPDVVERLFGLRLR